MKIARPVCPYPSILIQPEAHPPRVRRPWQLPFFRGLSLKKKDPSLSSPLSSFSFRTLILSRPFSASWTRAEAGGGCHEKSLLIVGSPTWNGPPPLLQRVLRETFVALSVPSAIKSRELYLRVIREEQRLVAHSPTH